MALHRCSQSHLARKHQGSVNDADGYYGTSGWVLPNLADNLYLPSYAPLEGITTPGTSVFASGTYAQDIDDPTQPISGTVADLPEGYWTIAYQSPGPGVEANLYNFTLSGTIPSAHSSLASPSAIWTHRGKMILARPPSAQALQGPCEETTTTITTQQIQAIANDKQIDWIFFRVDNAQAGDTISIFGTGGTNGMASLAAISFDPVPEPANVPARHGTWRRISAQAPIPTVPGATVMASGAAQAHSRHFRSQTTFLGSPD
jgi:hypothetical protein